MTAPAARIAALLRARPELILALLFGSLATGTARPDSDLDLAVLARGGPLDAGARLELILELAAATGRAVDLVDLATVGEPLLGQILAHGRRLLGTDAEYARLLIRHLYDQADFVPYQRRILSERRQAWIGT